MNVTTGFVLYRCLKGSVMARQLVMLQVCLWTSPEGYHQKVKSNKSRGFASVLIPLHYLRIEVSLVVAWTDPCFSAKLVWSMLKKKC